ncbi:hypothetical protein F2Q69_00020141 [Brassica cretica]|uniref:F-box associated beta-propeller type 1 domain-containing protein n=1 Tax=Brassica cretica TaxID=69181 RepID=A0A8S9QD45_BRACR|nr:hypothetical protein F2Q69_00020141 [Brassica cretica]
MSSCYVAWIKEPQFGTRGLKKVDGSKPMLAANPQVDGIAEERRYKTIGSYGTDPYEDSWWEIHEFVSDTWNDHEFEPSQEDKQVTLLTRSGVSLNGNLYWVGFNDNTDDPLYHLLNFDFLKKQFCDVFCYLPCGRNHPLDALVLSVFKGDGFSLLRQCHVTKKIEIWVTKNKINIEDGNDVVWMNFMTFSIPDFVSYIKCFTMMVKWTVTAWTVMLGG